MSKIQASPTKGFFVNMLTRDIDLDDAILDLLDNSLDGLLRQRPEQADEPYSAYCVDITISENEFTIHDNCGGIPTDIAENYAFMMGKPPAREDDEIPTVGMFGIGMKRAVFKMGKDITVISKNPEKCFYVPINSDWLTSDSWELDMLDCDDQNSLHDIGTKIIVKDLYKSIGEKFSKHSDFISELTTKIRTHYAYIIKKGLSIKLNGKSIVGRPVEFLFSENDGSDRNIQPYVYEENEDGLSVRIVVGLTGQSPGLSEIDRASEIDLPKQSNAGWTVICNERVVLYADRTRLTGWGDGLPRFHYQFNTIVGIVEFSSNDASKLPVKTTKEGIDASTDLYLRIRKRMIEGMKIFTDYTNKWKNLKQEEKNTVISKTKPISIKEIVKSKNIVENFTTVRDGNGGKQFKPNLPIPPSSTPTSKFIRYSKLISDIQIVSEYLFEESTYEPSEVGEACFDKILKDANS